MKRSSSARRRKRTVGRRYSSEMRNEMSKTKTGKRLKSPKRATGRMASKSRAKGKKVLRKAMRK
jgi:hypothetical protein